jgi:hypothetical protein
MTQKPHPPEPPGKIKVKKPTGDNERSALERAAMLPKAKHSRRKKAPK